MKNKLLLIIVKLKKTIILYYYIENKIYNIKILIIILTNL